jgi:hypothetical protein
MTWLTSLFKILASVVPWLIKKKEEKDLPANKILEEKGKIDEELSEHNLDAINRRVDSRLRKPNNPSS